MPAAALPTRSEVPEADTWDLSRLFPSDAEWEKTFAEWDGKIAGYARFRGRLAAGPESRTILIIKEPLAAGPADDEIAESNPMSLTSNQMCTAPRALVER